MIIIWSSPLKLAQIKHFARDIKDEKALDLPHSF
jgi:hypothetical protein